MSTLPGNTSSAATKTHVSAGEEDEEEEEEEEEEDEEEEDEGITMHFNKKL